jgi:phosphate transport system permease protein
MASRSARLLQRQIGNGVFVGFCYVVTAVALVALAAILWSLASQGLQGVNLDLFTLPTPASGSRGGLLNSILGTLFLCGMGMAIAVVVGVLAGTWLSEYSGSSRLAEVVRFLNDVLLSAPSILIGVFVWSVLVMVTPRHTFSALAGGVALAIIAVPIITRITEDVLRLQPLTLRESGVAVGAPFWTVIRKILWPAAGGGILSGALLALARISGESAPLLFTAFGNQFTSFDPTRPISSLGQVIFAFANTPYDDLRRLAWAGALLVTTAVLVVFIIARAVTARQPS